MPEEKEKTTTSRAKTRTSRARTSRASSTPKPPTTIKPGWVHHSIARFILKGFRERGKEVGVELNVGNTEFEAPQDTLENREPEELLARVIAHLGHRIPLLRRAEKHLEGTETRSGLMSDLAAFFTQLYARNEDVIDQLRRDALNQAKANRAAKKAAKDGNNEAPPFNAEPEIRIMED